MIFMMASLIRRGVKSSRTIVTTLCALLISATFSMAHEVRPTIADLRLTGAEASLDLRLNAEAFLAGIDLDGLEDTNAAEGAGEYDALRVLPPKEVATRLTQAWGEIGQSITLTTGDGRGVPLTLATVEVSEIGDTSVPRPTRVVISGPVPEGAKAVVLHWGDGNGTLILRHVDVEDGYTGYIEGGETSPPIRFDGGAGQTALSAFLDYIPVGFDHILPKGLDHILFVLGLFFLSPKFGPLLWQVSAFTAAHTVTLALGALGWVNVPGSIVEPLIAASITFIAVENILSSDLHRWRPVVVFLFGLLHGLGFASVLGEFGLPEDRFIPALLGFNIGVELGQLAVIAIAFLAVGAWFRRKDWYRAAIAIPASAVIGLVGAYWFVERTFL